MLNVCRPSERRQAPKGGGVPAGGRVPPGRPPFGRWQGVPSDSRQKCVTLTAPDSKAKCCDPMRFQDTPSARGELATLLKQCNSRLIQNTNLESLLKPISGDPNLADPIGLD